MNTGQYIISLMTRSVKSPREGARAILLLGLSRNVIWMALALVIVVGTLLSYVHQQFAPPVHDMDGNPVSLPLPLVSVAMTAVLLVALDFVTTHLGRAFGGTGNFLDLLLMDVWLRFLALGFMVISIAGFLISPALGQFMLFGTYILLFWLMLNFVAEAHGGLSLGKTLVLVLLSGVVTLVPIILFLQMMGVSPRMGV